MVNSRNKNELVGGTSNAVQWKRRPSEIKGYQRALYHNDAEGNYIRLDYNIKAERVRIYYESADEGGVSYYSVIEKQDIVTEKNLTSGRTTSLKKKFSELAPVIATIPNRDVIRIIGPNYGLDEQNKVVREKIKKQKLEKTRQRYFRQEREESEPFLGEFDDSKRFSILEVIDVLIGAAIGGTIFYFLFDFQILGIFLAVYGIGLGMLDIFVREREPFFFKIVLFIVAGIASFVYGYYIN